MKGKPRHCPPISAGLLCGVVWRSGMRQLLEVSANDKCGTRRRMLGLRGERERQRKENDEETHDKEQNRSALGLFY